MNDTVGAGATKKLTKRRIELLSGTGIASFSRHLNDTVQLENIEGMHDLVAVLSEIRADTDTDAEKERNDKEKEAGCCRKG